jgi:hypothetical protein
MSSRSRYDARRQARSPGFPRPRNGAPRSRRKELQSLPWLSSSRALPGPRAGLAVSGDSGPESVRDQLYFIIFGAAMASPTPLACSSSRPSLRPGPLVPFALSIAGMVATAVTGLFPALLRRCSTAFRAQKGGLLDWLPRRSSGVPGARLRLHLDYATAGWRTKS